MDIMSVPMVLDVVPNSSSVWLLPGAQMEDIMGEKVHMMMTHVISIHFLPEVQFLRYH
jgi:hypothetical protein